MGAGAELSVAATKTFVSSVAALLNLVATWTNDQKMTAALDRLPDRLASAAELDWTQNSEHVLRGTEPRHVGPWTDICHRAGSRLEAEGGLQHSCGSVQWRRIPAWADRFGLEWLSGSYFHADGCRCLQLGRAWSRSSAQARVGTNHGKWWRGERRTARTCPRPSRHRRGVLDPEFIRIGDSTRPAPRH